ncbi:phosphatidylinositol kinase [Aureococcus anophagefferens]|nr:phosphatidylinositol kinase [Aureococcus anophagefferens]
MRQLAGRGAQWHDGADGYVPVLGQADIEQLEVVACRLDDDADYLGGLSACRRRAQMPGTLRQRVREMEQEAQPAATGDAGPFRGAVDAAKLAAMERLSASTESYGRAYPYVAQLHAIREVEHAAELLDDPNARDSVLRRWDDRLLAGAKTSAAGWLAVRRVCLEVAGLPEDAGTCAMRSAKVARRAGRLTVAFGGVRARAAWASRPVVKRYELAVALRPDWARAYVSCGRYFDVLLASRRQQTSSDDDDDAGDDGGGVLARVRESAMAWYAGPRAGRQEAPSALPRLVTLWFEFGSVSVEKQAPQKPGARPSAKTERAKALERLKQEIYDVVRRASLSIPAAVWYTVTPQLVSRAAHPNPSLMRGVSELLAIILHAHPDEAVWSVTGLTQSLNPDRKKKMLHGAKQLFADLIAVAKHVPPDSAATVDMRRIGKQVKVARGLLVPTRAALTAAIAPRGKGGGDWPRFPDDSPRVDKFQDNIIVMKSKAKPKKLTLEASNGRIVRVLCKREKDGDLRKDARASTTSTTS